MAKVLDELPTGTALKARGTYGSSLARSEAPSAPSGPPAAKTAPKAGSRSDETPKGLRGARGASGSSQTMNRVHRASRGPGGFMNSQEGHEWMMRRCEQFGFASSRYFKGKHTAGTGKIET